MKILPRGFTHFLKSSDARQEESFQAVLQRKSACTFCALFPPEKERLKLPSFRNIRGRVLVRKAWRSSCFCNNPPERRPATKKSAGLQATLTQTIACSFGCLSCGASFPVSGVRGLHKGVITLLMIAPSRGRRTEAKFAVTLFDSHVSL